LTFLIPYLKFILRKPKIPVEYLSTTFEQEESFLPEEDSSPEENAKEKSDGPDQHDLLVRLYEMCRHSFELELQIVNQLDGKANIAFVGIGLFLVVATVLVSKVDFSNISGVNQFWDVVIYVLLGGITVCLVVAMYLLFNSVMIKEYYKVPPDPSQLKESFIYHNYSEDGFLEVMSDKYAESSVNFHIGNSKKENKIYKAFLFLKIATVIAVVLILLSIVLRFL